jgi:hypothetical protein
MAHDGQGQAGDPPLVHLGAEEIVDRVGVRRRGAQRDEEQQE